MSITELSNNDFDAVAGGDSGGFWETVGWAIDNPATAIGRAIDHMDEAKRSVDLSGSEYIDWKTGGWHRGENL